MDPRKVGNVSQLILAEETVIFGKRCFLVKNGALELLFNRDNALDIVWAKYRGVNISFLSKNGLNAGNGDFNANFEGGFLYTCGTDNISTCVSGKPIHGSLHYQKCDRSYSYTEDGIAYICGEVKESSLFGKNTVLKRRFSVTESSVSVCDTIENRGFTDEKYVLLYHFNYGYPFLDECLKLDIPATESEPLTQIARQRQSEMLKMTAPVDGGEEDVYYHTLEKGRVRLTNPDIGITAEMLYDTEDFPVTLEWKSMVSGDYALGIEPSLSRFDRFSMQALAPGEKKSYNIKINFI